MGALTRKKRVCGGHRVSTTKAIGRAKELIAAESPDVIRLSQLKLTLGEKLEVLKTLDAEMLDLVQDEDVAEEIDQEDEFKEKVHVILVKINRVLNAPPLLESVPPCLVACPLTRLCPLKAEAM